MTQPVFQSKGFDSINAIWSYMMNHSLSDKDGNRVWTGTQRQIAEELHSSIGYVSKLLSDMEKMRCVEQWRRGSRGGGGQYVLLAEPSQEAFLVRAETALDYDVTGEPAQPLPPLEERVATLERTVEVLAKEFFRRFGGDN